MYKNSSNNDNLEQTDIQDNNSSTDDYDGTISDEAKYICVCNTLSLIFRDNIEKDRNINISEMLYKFYKSETFARMFNLNTYLWTDGPDAIRYEYEVVEKQTSR